MLRQLAQFVFLKGYDSSSPKLAADSQTMASGSQNVILVGLGKTRIFKGFAAIAEKIGAKLGMIVGSAYGGLGFMSDTTAIGSIFRVLGAVFYIGAGRLMYNGEDTGYSASTTLSLQKISGTSLDSVQYQAGLAQPDAPTIAAIDPPSGYTGKNDGTVSVQIARIRSATGARSVASLTSNVVVCKKQCVAVRFPEADLNGQDYWEVDVTLNGYGGIGNHYFLQEVPETAFEVGEDGGSIGPVAATFGSSSTDIGLPNGTVTGVNLGWVVEAYQQEKVSVVATDVVTGAGIVMVTITAAEIDPDHSMTIGANVAIGDDASVIASKLRAAIDAYIEFGLYYTLSGTGRDIIVTRKKHGLNDSTFNVEIAIGGVGAATGVTAVPTSTNLTAGIAAYITDVKGNNTHSTGKQKVTLSVAAPATITQDVTISRAYPGLGDRVYVFEWKDADLAGADFAPTRDYPPPAGTHGGVSGDVTFVDGCYGEGTNVVDQTSNITGAAPGTAIAVSDPARPESFPPDNYLFTADPPTAIIEGGQGLHWRFGRNSLGVIRYVGGSPALSYEMLWGGIGVASQNNVVLGAGGRLYAYTGAQGAVRLGPNGEPDITFAARVANDFEAWTEEEDFDPGRVCLGYDANYGYVLFGYKRTIICYYEAIDAWCAPVIIPDENCPNGSIQTMVTANGNVYIAISVNDADPASDILIYAFDRPEAGGTTAKFVTQWVPSVTESDVISRVKLALRTDAASSVVTKVYTNGSSTASSDQTTEMLEAGFRIPTTLRPNVRNARMWQIETGWDSAGGDAGLEGIIVEGESSGITF